MSGRKPYGPGAGAVMFMIARIHNQSATRYVWRICCIVALMLLGTELRAACPEPAVVGTSLPVVYQDCTEYLNMNPGNPANSIIATSANTQVGDYLVLAVVRKSDTAAAYITAPVGWATLLTTTRNSSIDGENDLVMGVYAKVATSAGAENVPVTSDAGGSSNDLLMWVMRFSNTAGAGAGATNNPAASAIVTSPAVTTVTVNNLILRMAGIAGDDQVNAADFNGFGSPHTAITLKETAATGNSATGIAAYRMQASAGSSGTATFDNTGIEPWIAYTVALQPQPYFTLLHPAGAASCGNVHIPIAIRNIDGSINTAYTGTIQLSTSTSHGYWTTTGGDANGTLLTAGDGTGTASYTFSATDNGTIDLVFSNPNVEVLNFNVVDNATGYRELKTLDNDHSMAFNSCGSSLDHYHVSSSGMGISCLAENITFTGHGVGHNPVAPGAGVVLNISTSTGKGSWTNVFGSNLVTSAAANDGAAHYTFRASETSVTIPFNYTSPTLDPELVGFNVVDSASVRELEEGNLNVAKAGLRFFNDTSGTAVWPGQVAGMDSLLFTGQQLVVMGVKASDLNPAACEPLFSAGTILPVQLVFECVDSAVCASASSQVAVTHNGSTVAVNAVDNNAGPWVSGSAESGFVTLNMLFESFTNGDFGAGSYSGARIELNSPDVGLLQIHGRYRIPFSESSTGAFGVSGDYMTGSGQPFVVRPFGLDVDFADDRRTDTNGSLASSHTGPAFAKAGAPVNVTIKAVAWQAADDLDNNGIPDFEADLSNNTVTPAFGTEVGFNYRVGLYVITDHPASSGVDDNPGVPGGAIGTLDQNSTVFTFSNGISNSINNIALNEVGIFDVGAGLLDSTNIPTNYLGFQPVSGGVPNVGRITPDHYDLDLGASFIEERPDAGGSASFTYMGEPFGVELALQAEHADGRVLQNYFGDFAKLIDLSDATTQFSFKAFKDIDAPLTATDDIDYSMRLEPLAGSFVFDDPWATGLATVRGRLIFNRLAITGHPQSQQEAPITSMTIAIDLNDSDLIADEADVGDDDGTNETVNYTWHYVDSNEWRYGRLRLENAYGSELREEDELSGRDVAMRLATEYWDGSSFVVNSEDSSTALDIRYLYPVAPPRYSTLNSYEGNLTSGEFSNTPGMAKVLRGLTLEQSTDDEPFFFTAPGEGNDGSVIMEFDLEEAGLEFLSYKWRGAGELEDVFTVDDSEYDDDPRAFLEFGRYQGNERIINWQELFCQEPAPCP